MLSHYDNYPPSTRANIHIPKERFYQESKANQRIKRLFIDEVEKISLKVVIAPRTINISESAYDEMHIIEIRSKQSTISSKVLETIDSVIPRPILFVILRPNGDAKYAIAYKVLKSLASRNSKIVHYYETNWGVCPLQMVGNSVKTIFVNFIRQIEPSFDPSRPIDEAVQRSKQAEKIHKQIGELNRRIVHEPSISKRQALARERHGLEQHLADEQSKT